MDTYQTTMLVIGNVTTLILFILSESLPFLHPPHTGVVQASIHFLQGAMESIKKAPSEL